MAKNATSSLSAMGETAATAPDTGALRRSAGLGSADSGGPAYITAEIPAVPVAPSYGVLLPDGSVWYPGSSKRLPAPLPLRILVWILAFATLLAAAGVFVVRYHPSLLSAIRRTVPAGTAAAQKSGAHHTSTTSNGKGKSSTGTTAPASNGAVKELSPQPTLPPETTAYSVVARSYSVVVTAGAQPVWVFAQSVVKGVPVSTGRVFEDETVPAGGRYVITPTSGAVTVEVANGGATISVYHGPKRLGTLSGPPSPWHYWFERVTSH